MITLDTHVILWDALQPEMLSDKARGAIKEANQTDGLFFCSISLWEIAMLIRKKRIEVNVSYSELVDLLLSSNRYVFQDIFIPEIAYLSTTLPDSINSDPADGIICASSLITKTPLVTADENLRQSDIVQTIW